MNFNFTPPNVNGKTEKEQIQQLKSYLFQLTEQLNWAFQAVRDETGELKKSVNNTQRK